MRGGVCTLTETVREALGAFFAGKFRALLRKAGMRLATDEEAEEAVQETALKAARSLGNLRDPGSLRPWILSTLENECQTLVRRRLREEDRRVPYLEGPEDDLGSDAMDRATEGSAVLASLLVAPEPRRSEEVVRVVRREVARLPDHLRVPVERVHLLEEPLSEVARSLGLPRTTVAKRMARAHEILRPRLAPLMREVEG